MNIMSNDDFGKDLDIEEENASDNSFSIEETKDDMLNYIIEE